MAQRLNVDSPIRGGPIHSSPVYKKNTQKIAKEKCVG